MTHIVMNYNRVVPLIENDIEIGDRHYIFGENEAKGYDLQVILIPKNYIVVYMFESCYYIFLFEWLLIIHMAY